MRSSFALMLFSLSLPTLIMSPAQAGPEPDDFIGGAIVSAIHAQKLLKEGNAKESQSQVQQANRQIQSLKPVANDPSFNQALEFYRLAANGGRDSQVMSWLNSGMNRLVTSKTYNQINPERKFLTHEEAFDHSEVKIYSFSKALGPVEKIIPMVRHITGNIRQLTLNRGKDDEYTLEIKNFIPSYYSQHSIDVKFRTLENVEIAAEAENHAARSKPFIRILLYLAKPGAMPFPSPSSKGYR